MVAVTKNRLSLRAFVYSAILGGLMTFLCGPPSALAQDDENRPDARSSETPVSIEAYASRAKIAPGGDLLLALRVSVDKGWHINSNKPNEDFLIPAEVILGEDLPLTSQKIAYPAGRAVNFAFSPDQPLSVYDEVVWIKASLTISKDTKAGSLLLPVQVTTQACNDRSCVAPTTQTLPIPLEVSPGAAEGTIRHRAIFESIGMIGASSDLPAPAITGGSVPLGAAQKESFFTLLKDFRADAFVSRYGYILAFIAMYLLGMGLTLTPCVYPIIPITIGYFGSQSSGKWTRQLLLAAIFGFGIAVSYAIVGTLAAFTGSLVGAALQNRWVLVGLAALCMAMGLNAFGVYELRLPGWFMNLAGGGSRSGILGAAVMGLTMGVAAAPCLAAFIVSLLAFVGQKGDPVLGFSMFLVLGLGLATPFVALGTFSGLLSRVPRSGAWMVYAKKVMGALLFGAALYFLNTVLPARLHHALVLVTLVAAALYFGFFEKTPVSSWRFRAGRAFLGVVLLASAIWWGMPAASRTESSGIAWQPYSDALLAQAKAQGKPVIIDFYANWCIPCKELDKYAFRDQRVISVSKNFVMLKGDLTVGDTPLAKKLIKRYGLVGVPTVIFIGPDGNEIRKLRMVQYEPPGVVLARFNGLLATATSPESSTTSTAQDPR